MKNPLWKRIISTGLFGALSLGSLLVVSSATAAPDDSKEKITVSVNDLRGIANLDQGWVREDLLRNALFEAADDSEWIGDIEFDYNDEQEEFPKNQIVVNVVNWERGAAGFYNFRGNARFYDQDGNITNIGNIDGTTSGITVTTSRDVPEHYSAAAEDAFLEMFEELEEKLS